MKTVEQRFWEKVRKSDGCWLWTGAKGQGNAAYGRIRIGGRNGALVSAHRISWEIHRDVIPEGFCVLHKCDVRLCVNPNHLFLGTPKDNSFDMVTKGRSARGERQSRAKLTSEQVLLIRSRQWQSYNALALEFGVSRAQIGHICSRKHWAHLPAQ